MRRALTLLVLGFLLLPACSFFQSQASTGAASTCERSCANVPAESQGECIARCSK